MTKLDSKYLKDLIMEVMKVGDFELDVPKSIPGIATANQFAYTENEIPDELKKAVMDAFKASLGQTAIDDLMKISGTKNELDWQDFYAILLDPKTQLRQPALAAMRLVKDANSKYTKAFDEMLRNIVSDKPVRKAADINPYAAPVEDIVNRGDQPPPEYIREAFEILGLNALETLQERLKRLTDFSLRVVGGESPGTSIRETFSNLIVLNALSKIVRTLDSSGAGIKFEDFLALLTSGVAVGEGQGASDLTMGILSDANGNFSQHSSSKFVQRYTAKQAQKTMSMAMPGQSRPESFEDLIGFDTEFYDKKELQAAKAAFEAGETEKLRQMFIDKGVDQELLDKIEAFNIPKFDPAKSSLEKQKGSYLGTTPKAQQKSFGSIDFDNTTMTYVIAVKLGADRGINKEKEGGGRTSQFAKIGEPIPKRAVKNIPLEKVEIHVVSIKRVTGQGMIKDGDLVANEEGVTVNVSGTNVNIAGLSPNSRVGQLLLADSTETLVEKSNEAMKSVEENIPKIIKALARFSEKTKSTLISGKEDDINETTKIYTDMFSLINEIMYGTEKDPSKFALETGYQAGVETSGDTIVQRKAKKIN